MSAKQLIAALTVTGSGVGALANQDGLEVDLTPREMFEPTTPSWYSTPHFTLSNMGTPFSCLSKNTANFTPVIGATSVQAPLNDVFILQYLALGGSYEIDLSSTPRSMFNGLVSIYAYQADSYICPLAIISPSRAEIIPKDERVIPGPSALSLAAIAGALALRRRR
ncbi:MAG: hypothetical protein AB7G80_09545 [Dongiaceae bacterium]